ncbi:MlaE family ABC transporter permease [Haliangium ochraceum]|uniref:ABC transporter permease n=1 Tax=Haliangium ochraceum (strain DSM 14365 / JCM 11303 / SMP-2) TaxID=502025 RepID=D0LVA1_HALO1|nr:ABC transporter permease [Haliangium ochraceum]ACY15942.1 protein of unknown function DUF140 [Haliangium ochraceum DSM 14365]
MSDAADTPSLGARAAAYLAGAARALAELGALSAAAVASVPRRGWRRREVARQMYDIGNRSFVFIAVTMGFFGMVFIYQGALQLDRIVGDVSLLGREFSKLLVKDLGPSLTAMMLATRVGAGIAAELGSMTVTEQVDALRMSGVRPIDYLVAPRLLAALVMVTALAIFGTAVAFAAGGLTAWAYFDLNPRAYFDLSQVEFGHLGLGLVKAVVYAANIPLIAAFCGLRAHGGSAGVGRATTAAVIGSSFAVLSWDLALSLVALQLLDIQV